MKTMFCKLVFLVLVVSMIFPAMNISAANVDTAIFHVESLNLFEKEADGTMDWNKPITRAELSHAISILLNHSNQGYGYSLVDVTESTPYRNDIYNMVMYGLMSGDGDGYFRPNDNVTAVETAIVLLRVMGYNHILSIKEYPMGMLAYAASLGMMDGIATSAVFTRKDFALMLNNSLDIYLMSEIFRGGKEEREYYISDIKFGDVIFNSNDEGAVYYGVGVIMQNAMSFVDVSYRQLEPNEVIIDGVLFDAGNINVAEFLGMEVRYIAKEKQNGSYALLNVAPTSKNVIDSFDARDFGQYVSDAYITYFDINEKEKKIKINSETRIIKNYDVVATPSETIFKVDCGEYVVIDNDRDEIADVIMIYSYENAVISGAANNVIALKEGFSVNGSRYINLNEEYDEILYYVIDEKGNAVDINAIDGNSVISVASDKAGTIMKIVVNTKDSITGEISESWEDKVKIDDDEYVVLYNGNYESSYRYNFYLNFKNDIIYYEISDDSTEIKYAYVMGATSDGLSGTNIKLLVSKKVDFGIEVNDDDADNVTQIPMLICQNEEILILDMADRVKVNGVMVDDQKVAGLVSEGDRLYRFELNEDGKLKSLESVNFKAGSLYQTFTYNIYDKCFGAGSVAYEGFAINENSQILCLPTNPSCDEDYMVKNVINKEGNMLGYYVRGYNYDPVTKKCRLVVINREMKYDNLPGVTVASSKMAIVKRFSKVMVDNEIVGKLQFAIAGEDKEMYLTRTATEAVPSLSAGDLFTYTEDYEDRITNILKIKSMSSLSDSFANQSGLASGANETFGHLKDIAYDEVDENTTSLVMEFFVDVNGYQKILNVPQRNKPPIYVYSNKNARNGGVEDIIPGSDKVYVFMSDARNVTAVVVVK